MRKHRSFTKTFVNLGYTEKSVGVGECAGAVVDQAEFMLEDADRLNFEATLALDEGRHGEAARKTFQAGKKAADGILSTQGLLLSDNYDTVAEFRKHFYETNVFLGSACRELLPSSRKGNRRPDSRAGARGGSKRPRSLSSRRRRSSANCSGAAAHASDGLRLPPAGASHSPLGDRKDRPDKDLAHPRRVSPPVRQAAG